jgi:quercetin dioxygenase-like cupin family protein
VPVGWNPVDWHANPQVQFVFWLAGEMRFEAEDGTVKIFRAGEIYFGDDLKSARGHHR